MNTKKSSFELSPWAIILIVTIFIIGFASGFASAYFSTNSSLKVENATLRANIPGGLAGGEEQKALERQKEQQDQRDKDQEKNARELNSTLRSTGKAEGKAEQLIKDNEVMKQSLDKALWENNILLVFIVVGGFTAFLHIRKLQYSIYNRDRTIEAIRVQIYNPNGNIDQIKTAFETSTQFIESEQISNQKLLKSSSESEEYMT